MTTEPDADAVRRLCHDLRSPLAVVDGFAKLLESAPPDKAAEYVARIRAAAREMTEMLDATTRC